MSKLWQKSSTDTESSIAKKVEAFTVGNDYELDQVLVPYDLKGSEVHAKALHKSGILTEDELEKITEALHDAMDVWKKGEFSITVQDEDMHTAIENFLIDKLGELGKKIHTGRSRNDQVLTAMRLYEKEQLDFIISEVKKCSEDLLHMAESHKNTPMPGFTHTRKAMLSSVALWAGGFAEMLLMQVEFSTGIQKLIDKSPLGTAAGFGTSFDIDREYESKELGFSEPIACATTAQLSRGAIELQLIQFLSGITSVLNRLAADVISYSSESTPYFQLHEVVCTGSSIMPQKKNPDLAELIRGGHAELLGASATLQGLIQNLGSGYHRDLQLSKEPVLKAFKKTAQILEATRILVQHINPNTENLKRAVTDELFAAEAANKLVKEHGISFREAYRKVADEPELTKAFTFQKLLEQQTHLGTPGNPGLDRLKTKLEKL